MEAKLIKYAIMAVLAAVSGFSGWILFYSLYAAIYWLQKKIGKEKIWGGLIGVGINALIFLLTFPTVYPVILEAVDKVLLRFLD